jgi:hypothetical protein
MELEELSTRLTEAVSRIERLEEALSSLQEAPRWQYLVSRPHRWRRQLSIKGRNMTVGQLVSTLCANHLTAEQGAEEFSLPLAAVEEALAYWEQNRPLIELEASEERRRLAQEGHALEPKDLPR